MRVIKTDNYDREGPGHDDVIVAENVTPYWGERVACLLNANSHGDDFFKCVPDDYKLKRFEP